MFSIQVFALFVITRRCLVISSFFSCAHFSYDVVAYMRMRFALNFFHVYFHLGDLDTVLVPLLSQIWSHIYNKTEYMNSLLEGDLLFFFFKIKIEQVRSNKDASEVRD